jgi:hypothetical protein
MTLETAIYGLPYQEATDAPCDAPEVWCDLASRVNEVMTGSKNVIDRLEPTVPLAVVTRTTQQVFDTNTGPIVWDTVEADTDAMVDFDASAVFVFPRRTGIYEVSLWAQVFSSTTPIDTLLQLFIVSALTNFPTPFSASGSASLSGLGQDDFGSFAPGANNRYHIRAFSSVLVDDSFLNQSAFNSGGFGAAISLANGVTVVEAARLSAYYVREAL